MQHISKSEFYGSALFCIDHAIPIHHIFEYMCNKEDNKDVLMPERYFERLLTQQTLSIEVFLNKRLFREFTTETTKSKLKIDQSYESLTKMLPLMQDGLFYELGMTYPVPKFTLDKDLTDIQMRFKLNDIHYPPVRVLRENEYVVNDTAERLRLLNIEGKIMEIPQIEASVQLLLVKMTRTYVRKQD